MHALTQQIVTELEVLYGLYQMAADVTKKMLPEDEERIQRVLEARQKILDHTTRASAALGVLLKAYQAERLIPGNERALVEEKRNLLMDAGARIQAVDHQMIRQMQAKLGDIRKSLAEHTEIKNVVKAYMKSPQPQLIAG